MDTLYFKRPYMDDAPPGSIYVADSSEEPYLTMVPATYAEVLAWLQELQLEENPLHRLSPRGPAADTGEVIVRTDRDSGDIVISRRG